MNLPRSDGARPKDKNLPWDYPTFHFSPFTSLRHAQKIENRLECNGSYRVDDEKPRDLRDCTMKCFENMNRIDDRNSKKTEKRPKKVKVKSAKRDAIQWAVLIGVIALLWVTGWHRPVIAGIQRAVLATGIVQPKVALDDGVEGNAVDMKLVDEVGRSLLLSEFREGVTFVNFWATWCPPCRAEMPGIQNLYEDMAESGVAFVMIATDRDFDLAIRYKKENGYTFPIYRLDSGIPQELYGSSIPRTYVLGIEGNVRMAHEGMAKYDTEKFRNFLTDLQGAAADR